MTLVNVLLHINRWSCTLLKGLWNTNILADCIQIKLRYISAAAFNLILLVSASISRLCSHAHLSSRLPYNRVNAAKRLRASISLFHLDLLSFHLTAIPLNSLCAVRYLLVEYWDLECLWWLYMVKNWILPMPTAWTPIYFVDSLLYPCHIDHRLLLLVRCSGRYARVPIGYEPCDSSWGREMHMCCLGRSLPCRVFLLANGCRDLLLNGCFFLSLNGLMVIHKGLLLGLILCGNSSHILLKNPLVQRDLSQSRRIRLRVRLRWFDPGFFHSPIEHR